MKEKKYDSFNNEPKAIILEKLIKDIEQIGFNISEVNDNKPWGAYLCISKNNTDKFIEYFFEDLDPLEARLGIENIELSPKILLVSPGHRLSWQYHDRRAERWIFLTEGSYAKSLDDNEGQVINASIGDEIQFKKNERHRLIGKKFSYTVVAEIWQHLDKNHPSDELDIVRLQDDYIR